MGSVAAVRLIGLTKFYGRRLGVQDVSFEVNPGEVVGFLGPNGSGKTTVLRMLVGLLRPTPGRAEVFGSDVSQSGPDIRERVGYLPGTLSLYQRMTAGAYLDFMAAMRRRDCSARATELCERFGVNTGAHIGEMSKGNRQKVGVVQAFMHDPDLLVMDEPTSGLDPVVPLPRSWSWWACRSWPSCAATSASENPAEAQLNLCTVMGVGERKSVATKVMAGVICTMVFASAQLPLGNRPAHASDSNAVLIAYNPTTISQQVNVSNIADTTQFSVTANVAKNNWQNDYAYLEVRFKNSGGTVLVTKRSPGAGWTTLTSATPVNLTVSLQSTDASWSASIAAVEVIVGGDDGEYWAGNYGTIIDYVTLEQTTSAGTTQLLSNPEFASGSASWSSSAGWQACSGGAGAAACVYSAYSPPTTTSTTTTSTTTTSTTTTSTTTTTPTTTTPTTVAPSTSTTGPTTTTGAATSTTALAGSGGPDVDPAVTVPGTTSAPDATASQGLAAEGGTSGGRESSPASLAPRSVATPTSTTSTSTTLPAVAASSDADAPVDPSLLDRLEDGASLGLLDGRPVEVDTRVGDGTVVITVGTTSFQVSAPDDAPGSVEVDSDGRVLLGQSMQFKSTILGVEPGAEFEVWLYSTPVRVFTGRATDAGSYGGTNRVPEGAPRGWHNLVLSARTSDGTSVVASVNVNLPQRTNFVAEIARSSWVWVLIALAVGTAVLLPGGGLRRRRPATR